MPQWAALPALTRFTLSSPKIGRWFTGYDRTQPRHRRVRPGTFGLLAHTDPMVPALGHDTTPRPTTTYQPNPSHWGDLDWYDRTTGGPIEVTTSTPHDPDFNTHLEQGRVRIQTLGDVLAAHRTRPEHKSLAPDGTPTNGETQGLLQRRPVKSAPVLTDLIGKEGNDLEERSTGIIDDPDDYRTEYGNRGDRWSQLVLPFLDALGAEEVMRRTGRSRSAVYEVLGGRTKGTGVPSAKYREVAIEEAANRLRGTGLPVPRHPYGVLYLARTLLADAVKLCDWCHQPLPKGTRRDARYHAECRRAAQRADGR
ncbi:MAG: hypothetical protein WED83_07570 [Acidimicrobiia bacterium]